MPSTSTEAVVVVGGCVREVCFCLSHTPSHVSNFKRITFPTNVKKKTGEKGGWGACQLPTYAFHKAGEEGGGMASGTGRPEENGGTGLPA